MHPSGHGFITDDDAIPLDFGPFIGFSLVLWFSDTSDLEGLLVDVVVLLDPRDEVCALR